MSKIGFHEESELLKYKISNYDSFEYSKSLVCPECGKGTEIPYHSDDCFLYIPSSANQPDTYP